MLRPLLIAALVGLALSGAAVAQSFEDRVVRQLHDLGYTGITVSRTLLGRSRIKGISDEGRREIILDPRTGVILRDYLYVRRSGESSLSLPELFGVGGDGGNGGGNSGKGSANSGSGSDDDDRGDDDRSGPGGGDRDDDSDDRDNSGPGGGGDRDDDD